MNKLWAFSRCWFLLICELNRSSLYQGGSKFLASIERYRAAIEVHTENVFFLNISWANFVSSTGSSITTLRHIKTQLNTHNLAWLTIPKHMTLTISPFVNPLKNVKYNSKPNTIITWIQWMNPYLNKLAYLKTISLEKS